MRLSFSRVHFETPYDVEIQRQLNNMHKCLVVKLLNVERSLGITNNEN